MGRVGFEASPVVDDGTQSIVVEVVVVAGVTAAFIVMEFDEMITNLLSWCFYRCMNRWSRRRRWTDPDL